MLRTPINRRTVVLMGSRLPIPVPPRVVTEFGGVFQLRFSDSGPVALHGGIIFES